MLEEMVVILWVEERLDSSWTADGSVETFFAESPKSCEQQSFAPVN